MTDNNSDFYNQLSLELHKLASKEGKCDMMLVPDLLDRGKHFVMTWLKDETLRERFADDAMMFYYNVACIAFCGGIGFADAFEKDVSQVKLGFVDTLLAAQPDMVGFAHDILDIKDDDEKIAFHQMLDDMFATFLNKMNPYWLAEDPRPFLFQGLMAFFQTGVSFRLNK